MICAPDPTFSVSWSVDHWRKGALHASTLLGCDISRHHRIHIRQWLIGGCEMHDTDVS